MRRPGQSLVASAKALLQSDPSATMAGFRYLSVMSTTVEPASPRWGWNSSAFTVLAFRTGFATSFPAERVYISPEKERIVQLRTHLRSSKCNAKG